MNGGCAAKRKIKNGEPFLMAFLVTCDTATAEVMAMSGVDVIVVDNEHMAMTDRQLLELARAITMHGSAALLRTACKDTEQLMRWMEFGFSGLCCTQCHGLEDAKKAIEAVKYPPVGRRGLGTDGRAAGYGFLQGMSAADYMAHENENTLIFVTLEDMGGIRSALELAALDEIDEVHIGPMDLSASMGFGGDPRQPEVQKVIRETKAALAAAGNPREEFVDAPEHIPALIEAGARCLVIETDLSKLKKIYCAHTETLRQYMANG